MQNTKKIFFASEKPKILFCNNTSNWKTFSENNITVPQVSICQTKVFGSLLSLKDASPWAWRAQVWFDKDVTRKSCKEHNCWCWRWPCHFNSVWIRFRKKQKQPLQVDLQEMFSIKLCRRLRTPSITTSTTVMGYQRVRLRGKVSLETIWQPYWDISFKLPGTYSVFPSMWLLPSEPLETT